MKRTLQIGNGFAAIGILVQCVSTRHTNWIPLGHIVTGGINAISLVTWNSIILPSLHIKLSLMTRSV